MKMNNNNFDSNNNIKQYNDNEDNESNNTTDKSITIITITKAITNCVLPSTCAQE